VVSEQDINRTVEAATAAFSAWRDMAGSKRAARHLKFADLIEKNLDKLAHLENSAVS
jgi:aldehyde dehydrogenase (NAD+)